MKRREKGERALRIYKVGVTTISNIIISCSLRRVRGTDVPDSHPSSPS